MLIIKNFHVIYAKLIFELKIHKSNFRSELYFCVTLFLYFIYAKLNTETSREKNMNGPDFQNQFKLAPDNYLGK